MKTKWFSSLCLGGLAILTTALAIAAVHVDEEPLALEANPAGGELGSFSCGAWCGSNWIHVVTCYSGQFCCGYLYCHDGGNSAQGTCCNVGTQTCSWDGQTLPPPPIQCINNP